VIHWTNLPTYSKSKFSLLTPYLPGWVGRAKISDIESRHRQEIEKMERQLALKTKRVAELETVLTTTQYQLSASNHHNNQMREELSESMDRNQKNNFTMEKIEEENSSLKFELAELKPVVRLMAAVRKRQNIQTRRSILGNSLTQYENRQIRNGNEAAHGGDGLVDEALITHGYMPIGYYGPIFQLQYNVKPGSFAELHPLLQRTINYEVGLRTMLGTSISEHQRRLVQNQILNIKKELHKVETGAEPLIDLKYAVDILEYNTRRVVEMDRQPELYSAVKNFCLL
jgi:hypothetical protein